MVDARVLSLESEMTNVKNTVDTFVIRLEGFLKRIEENDDKIKVMLGVVEANDVQVKNVIDAKVIELQANNLTAIQSAGMEIKQVTDLITTTMANNKAEVDNIVNVKIDPADVAVKKLQAVMLLIDSYIENKIENAKAGAAGASIFGGVKQKRVS